MPSAAASLPAHRPPPLLLLLALLLTTTTWAQEYSRIQHNFEFGQENPNYERMFTASTDALKDVVRKHPDLIGIHNPKHADIPTSDYAFDANIITSRSVVGAAPDFVSEFSLVQ